MKSIKLAAIIENLDQFISFVHTCSEECGFDGKREMEIELAVEEALVNIFNYAYPDGEGQVEIFFIKKVADEVRYSRNGDMNVLTIVFLV